MTKIHVAAALCSIFLAETASAQQITSEPSQHHEQLYPKPIGPTQILDPGRFSPGFVRMNGLPSTTSLRPVPLRRIPILLFPPIALSHDMTGWTPVTNAGSTGDPVIIPLSPSLLVVRGKDKSYYTAAVSIGKPAMIDSSSWLLWDEPLVGLSCVPYDSTIYSNAYCSFYKHNNTIRYISLIMFPDPNPSDNTFFHAEGKTLSYGYGDFVMSNNSKGIGLSMLHIGDAAGLTPVFSWDGHTQLLSARLKDPDNKLSESKNFQTSWKSPSFSIYGPPSCGGNNNGNAYCIFGDGVGNTPTLYSVSDIDADPKPILVATLAPPPPGGGMAKGEASVVITSDKVSLFMRGKDGHLWSTQAKLGTTSFPKWSDLGGWMAPGSVPSCVRVKMVTGCAIRGDDNRIYMRTVDSQSGL